MKSSPYLSQSSWGSIKWIIRLHRPGHLVSAPEDPARQYTLEEGVQVATEPFGLGFWETEIPQPPALLAGRASFCSRYQFPHLLL